MSKRIKKCCINGCISNSQEFPTIKFGLFPLCTSKNYNDWVECTEIKPTKGKIYVCEKHFSPYAFSEKKLRPGYLPNWENVEMVKKSPIVVAEVVTIPPIKCLSCINWKCKYLKLLRKKNTLYSKTKYKRKPKVNLNQMIDEQDHLSREANVFCKMLLNKRSKTTVWVEEQRNLAHTINFKSQSAYRFLRKLGFTLPSPSSLNRWLPIETMTPGFNIPLLAKMKEQFVNVDSKIRKAVLTFDEMHCRSDLEYNIKLDLIDGVVDDGDVRERKNATELCCFMVRGVFSSYNFIICHVASEGAIPAEKLSHYVYKCIDYCKKIGIEIVATVCDQNSNNRSCYTNYFEVTEDNPQFIYQECTINAMFDTPHLLKSLRNLLLKNNLETPDGPVDWNVIKSLYTMESGSTTKLCPKLTNNHMFLNSFSKMKVKYAANCLSRTVSAGIKTLHKLDTLKK